MVSRVFTKSKASSKDLMVKDIGGRKARVGITISEALTSLVPAMFSLAIMGTALGIMSESLSQSGIIGKREGNNSRVH